ncbi:MAG TPA: DUF2066 domain-containing protein [bacterium]|nr:DUF2066 domain-containing protein [bacterium]
MANQQARARRRLLTSSLGGLLVAFMGAAPSFGQSGGFSGGTAAPKDVPAFSFVARNLASMYQAVAVVTGSDRRYRGVGFAQCLRTVLAKVSGNPRLEHDPRVDRFAREANLFVGSFDYVDQMAAYHVKDDQGTYDRPYNLTVRFVPAQIDALLARLDERPWRGARPVIVAALAVRGARTSYLLSADSAAGADQRSSLEEMASELGIPVRFPTDAELTAWGATLQGSPLPRASLPPEQALVAGSLEFQAAVPGWAGAWRMRYRGNDYAWTIRGVNFDAAFRDLVNGVVLVASGHGAPE